MRRERDKMKKEEIRRKIKGRGDKDGGNEGREETDKTKGKIRKKREKER